MTIDLNRFRRWRRRDRAAPRYAPPPGPLLARCRTAALYAIAALVIGPALVSFAESYRGLIDWSLRHDLPAGWAYAAPLMVDTFVALGELALFVAVLDRRDFWPARAQAWAIAAAGLALSVAGNVGHLPPGAPLADRLTAGVAPVAAAASLAVGLGILKRAAAGAPNPIRVRRPRPAAAPPPPVTDAPPDAPADVSRETPDASVLLVGAEAAARAHLLTLDPSALPSARSLADSHLGGNRRHAARVLASHHAASNGHGDHR